MFTGGPNRNRTYVRSLFWDYAHHYFRIVYDAPLNKSNQDRRVTFIEYWEENTKTGKIQRFSWITDLDITEDNVYLFMRGARARWKIENETFNTLKNQGYNFGHNYGLGKQHLTEVFVFLMMLRIPMNSATHSKVIRPPDPI